MQAPVIELKKRLDHIYAPRAECFSLRAMLVDMPDLVIWRKTAESAIQAKRTMVGLDGLIGFAITQKNALFDIYDRHGAFVASENRTSPPLIGLQIKENATVTEAVAKHVLAHPYRLAESNIHHGGAVNIQANYVAITRLLLAGEGHEEHMAGVSWAGSGGGDVLFIDVVTAPNPMKDTFLDNMRQIKNGDVIDWGVYDQEMLRAVRSYREPCFCGWLVEAAGSKLSSAEVMRRMTMLDPQARRRLVLESLAALLPHISYYTGENKYEAETLDLDGRRIALPPCVLKLLGSERPEA